MVKAFKDNVFQLSSQFYLALLSFTLTMVLVRFLSTEQFAIYKTFFSLTIILGALQTGLGVASVRMLKENLDHYSSIFFYSSFLSGLIIFLTGISYPFWSQYYSDISPVYLIPLFLIIAGDFIVTDTVLPAQKKFALAAKLTSICKTLITGISIYFAINQQLFLTILVGSSYGIIKTIVILYYERERIDIQSIQFGKFFQLLKETPKSSMAFFSSNHLRANILVVSAIMGAQVTAELGALNIFAEPYKVVATALASTSIVQGERNRIFTFILGVILLLGGTLIINVAPEMWVNLLTGGKYKISEYVLPYTLGMVGLGLLQIFTSMRLNHGKIPWETLGIAGFHIISLTFTNNISDVVMVTVFSGALSLLVVSVYSIKFLKERSIL